ncbi:MAG: M28 family peptidase [Treponema sp.]|nr:M28 family peptidase [Treponema sp.]
MPSFLPSEFSLFIAPNTDRKAFIQKYLADRGVNSVIVPIDGKNHILVRFAQTSYSPQFKLKTVLCHYDRVENSPGANDNSAACFQLMDWAVRLSKYNGIHNVRLFFTDGEELGGHGGITKQGAFGLASLYRKLGITKDDVYVFDSCGRGNIAVMSQKYLPFKGNTALKKQFFDLCSRTENLLRAACPNSWYSLPMPYSDNAGFLACGIPAVVITMLPAIEVEQYAKSLMMSKDLEKAILNPADKNSVYYKPYLPVTWKMFHTPNDNIENLTQESFTIMARILDALALSYTVAL